MKRIGVTPELPPSVARAISDKTYERRKQAALEVETLVQNLVKQNETGRIFLIVDALATQYAVPSAGNSNARKGGLLCLAAVAVGLSGTEIAQQEEFISRVAPPILTACTDTSDHRVRYYALEALYNVGKSTRPAILGAFPEIFDVLFKLCSDPDRSVQNAASILDELMKSSIADASNFPFDAFLPKLAACMAVDLSQQRQFLLGWISLLDGLPSVDARLLRTLPQLLPGMLDFLGDKAPEVQNAAAKLLQQLMEDACADPAKVNVIELATALTDWLAENEGSGDDKTRTVAKAMALTWLKSLISVAPKQLSALAPQLLQAALSCIDTSDSEMQALGLELNEELYQADSLLHNADLSALLATAADGIGAFLQETAKIEALRWTAELLQRFSASPSPDLEPAVLPALCDALHSLSDRVVQEAVYVLAAVSGAGDEGCKRALSSVVGCFRGVPGAKLLQRRGAAIIERLSQKMGACQVVEVLAQLLGQEQDLAFASMMAQAVSLILLTSPELEDARKLLASALTDPDGASFLVDIFPGLSCSVSAALSIAFLARAYLLAAEMIAKLTEQPLLADMASSVVDLGQIVSLLEAPVFAGMRLELIAPRRKEGGLLRALYSLLLVLPQGEAFRLLQQRLNCVPLPLKGEDLIGGDLGGSGGGGLSWKGSKSSTGPDLEKLLEVFVQTQSKKVLADGN